MDNVYQEGRERSFVVFNDGALSMEPVTDDDILPVHIDDTEQIRRMRSQTWSCDIRWFFIICDTAVVLVDVYSDRGYLCHKKSARFIEAFLEAPIPKKHRAKRKDQP